jgi:hypothetical protein
MGSRQARWLPDALRQERPQLAEDPGGRAPDVEPADPVAAVAEPPPPSSRSTISIGAGGTNSENGASTIAATSSGDADSAGGRAAIATTGVTR